jgi:hypothetical protein
MFLKNTSSVEVSLENCQICKLETSTNGRLSLMFGCRYPDAAIFTRTDLLTRLPLLGGFRANRDTPGASSPLSESVDTSALDHGGTRVKPSSPQQLCREASSGLGEPPAQRVAEFPSLKSPASRVLGEKGRNDVLVQSESGVRVLDHMVERDEARPEDGMC